MTTSLNANIKLDVVAELLNSLDLGTARHALQYGYNAVLTDGTGANQAKELFTDTRTLAASGSEDLDLAGGLTDALGNTLTFSKIKALIIKADAGNTNDVLVGGHATAAIASLFGDATDKVRVKPGGLMALVAPDANGYAITATTADLLTVANSAGTTGVTYSIIVIGTT